MLNLIIKKDRDRSKLCITWPRIGVPTSFVQQFGLNFLLVKISINSKFVFYFFNFNIVALTSSHKCVSPLAIAAH